MEDLLLYFLQPLSAYTFHHQLVNNVLLGKKKKIERGKPAGQNIVKN